jgi:chromosome segregation ATPase
LDLEIKNLTTDYNTASRELTAANKIVEDARGTYNDLSKALSDMETEELEKLPKTFKKIDGETAAQSIERARKETEQYVNGALDKLPKEVTEANEGLKEHRETLEKVSDEVKRSSAEYTAYTDTL